MSKPMFKSNASFLLKQGWLVEQTSAIFNKVEFVALCTLRSLILWLSSCFIWQELIKRKSKFQALAKAREQCDLQSSEVNWDELLQKTVLLSLVYHNESKNSRGCVSFAVMNLFITGTVPLDLKVYEIFNRLCLHVLLEPFAYFGYLHIVMAISCTIKICYFSDILSFWSGIMPMRECSHVKGNQINFFCHSTFFHVFNLSWNSLHWKGFPTLPFTHPQFGHVIKLSPVVMFLFFGWTGDDKLRRQKLNIGD